jgi:hypothetical protein
MTDAMIFTGENPLIRRKASASVHYFRVRRLTNVLTNLHVCMTTDFVFSIPDMCSTDVMSNFTTMYNQYDG